MMTTTSTLASAVSTTAQTDTPTSRTRQTLWTAIRSEWIKARSLKSTWIGALALVAVLVGVAVLAALTANGVDTIGPGGQDPAAIGDGSPLSTVLLGANFAVLIAGVLGSLVGAREYGSRMIVTTAVAVPRRWQIVVSKVAAFVAVTLPATLVGVFGAFFVGMGMLSASGNGTVSITDSGVLISLIGMAGYLTAIGIIGLALGMILRNVGGSIAAVVAGVLVLPGLAGNLLAEKWDPILAYLPSSSAAAFTETVAAGSDVLSGPVGAIVLTVWTLAAVFAAIATITRRDV